MATRMHATPRISIGLPVYNGERFLPETLDSLLAQTYEDFELIISDNASTDRTEQICRDYITKDRRISYYRNTTNLGATNNYRKVFELASGEYFRWANADDLFAPESLARCIEVLDHEPLVVLAYPKTKFIDEHGRLISDYEDDLHLVDNTATERFIQVLDRLGRVNGIYGLVRTESLRKTKLIRNFVGGDLPLIAELSLYGKFWRIPEFLFYRRLHPHAYSAYKKVEQLQEFFDPKSKGTVPLTEWRRLVAHFDSVGRAPLGSVEKIHLIFFLLRVGFWNRKKLVNEVLAVFC
jgi:glycosyltransferase involved in cell wall biosynthesis